jgi:hypothetical protein
LQNLIARFGESDVKVLADTQVTTVLSAYYQPVTVRLASRSLPHTMRLDDPGTRRSRPLRMPNLGSTARDRVTVLTGCGDFPYDVTATVVGNSQVRVSVALDTAAARQSVARAVELSSCVELVK